MRSTKAKNKKLKNPNWKQLAMERNALYHPKYKALIDTRLFEDVTPQTWNGLIHLRRLAFIEETKELKNNLSFDFVANMDGSSKILWTLLGHQRNHARIDFEEVFEILSPETKEKLIWHLDLFK